MTRLLLVVVAALCAMAMSGAPVRTIEGRVRGAQGEGVETFRGIPYAAPPVGDLRWKPPQRVARWREVRDARGFGPSCPQNDPFGGFAAPSLSEDCLYLNVFTPSRGGRAPVMVFIHGGALRAGSSSDYDASALAREGGVVVVTLNYRLGALGFYANAALGEDNASANYGVLDQIAALEWVKRNIRRFGGDPRNVTVFGESAGARTIQALLASPMARGLFHHAILQSISADNTITRAAAEERGADIAGRVGCAPQDVACLRAAPVERLLEAQAAGPSTVGTAGGADLPEAPGIAIREGRFNKVPVIYGWNRDEATWMTAITEFRRGGPVTEADYRAAIETYGAREASAAIAAAYPLLGFAAIGSAVSRLRTDGSFVCPTLRMLADLSRYVAAYGYEFAEPNPPMYMQPASFPYETAHTSELQFLFPGFHGGSGTFRALSPEQERLALQMRALWAGFAHGRLDPAWRPFEESRGNIFVLRSAGATEQTRAYYEDRNCRIWDATTQ